jgi:hypothetical protein
MRVPKDQIPAKIDVPGAKARQLSGFGAACGDMGAEYFSLAAGTDIAPLLEGLEGDLCQCEHWGYVIAGDLFVSYADGTSDRCLTGDLFHWPAGHSVRADSNSEIVLFSPEIEHVAVMDHMLAKMAVA